MRSRSVGVAERWHMAFRSVLTELHQESIAGPDRCLVGLEHEYEVRRGTEKLDFALLLARMARGRRHLDPADGNAYRLPSGAALTADEREAEVALPPVLAAPGFTMEVLGRIAEEERDLARGLPTHCALVGVSTHVSVEVDAPLPVIDELARRYVQTFGPAMMLLLDRRDSWGIYVRPRPGRLEICGEFARGARLRAVLVFAVGSVRAMASAVANAACAGGPPPLRVRITDGGNRTGYTLWRTSGVGDTYVDGRDARFEVRDTGMFITAQDVLEQAWEAARAALPSLSASELAVVEQFVRGPFPLPVRSDPTVADNLRAPDRHPYGRLVEPMLRTGYDMAPVMSTWPVHVFLAAALPKRRRAFVCVPRTCVSVFVDALDAGTLDPIIRAYLATRASGRRLARSEDAVMPGLWDELGPRRELLPPELPARAADAAA